MSENFKKLEEIHKNFIKNFIDSDGNLTELGLYCVLLGASYELKDKFKREELKKGE